MRSDLRIYDVRNEFFARAHHGGRGLVAGRLDAENENIGHNPIVSGPVRRLASRSKVETCGRVFQLRQENQQQQDQWPKEQPGQGPHPAAILAVSCIEAGRHHYTASDDAVDKDQQDPDEDEENGEGLRLTGALFAHDENTECDETAYVKGEVNESDDDNQGRIGGRGAVHNHPQGMRSNVAMPDWRVKENCERTR